MASKSQISDILILGLISGIVAVLTSVMGISGTIIGSVVSSIIAEFLKTYFKEPVKDKISEFDKTDEYHSFEINNHSTRNNYQRGTSYPKYDRTQKQSESHISTRALFLFPLVVILIIELIHFLGAIGIIPYDIFLGLESITNWTLLRTIGYALIVMGIYPLVSKKLGTHHGIILIIVGIIELIMGYADTNVHASLLYSLFSSIREYVNIAIIISILYTVLTVPSEIKDNKKELYHYSNKSYVDNNVDKHLRNKRQYNEYYNDYSDNTNYRKSRNKKNGNNQYKKYETNIKEDEDDYFYY
ncbi:hypothetical protein [Methanosphaera sp. WGK6]|uniref:hypothetical protein n=1 Tax=Methanosphaera sp. WGK6 TaxID=1561964 RepID=UPI00084C114D|nr:hypothetical protein [Methanosphaera sp. WGK6]OED30194.1 hypothetical protein NL43_03395 [Methanosphaera sp. WGK6]